MIFELLIEKLNEIYLEILTEFSIYRLTETEVDEKKDVNKKSEVNVSNITYDEKSEKEDKDDKTIISNDFEIRIKWLSKQFDKLYNVSNTMFRKDIKYSTINRQISEVHELYSFFIENLDKYSPEEQEKIYSEFKNILEKIVEEIKSNTE